VHVIVASTGRGDNVPFGLRAVDQVGNQSPVAFPQTVTT